MTFPASCSDTGELQMTINHTAARGRDALGVGLLHMLATISGTVVLKSMQPPTLGVGSSVGCGKIPAWQETGKRTVSSCWREQQLAQLW